MGNIMRLDVSRRLSRIVVHGGVAYLAGVTAEDTSQDIAGQTCQVVDRIDELLTQAGTDKSRLLTTQIWLKDIARDFSGMNEVWDGWTAENAAPTRATAQCEMAEPEILIEVIASAALSD